MDYKKSKADPSAITRDINTFDEQTGNLYESVAIIAKRANQISAEIKEEINDKMQDFASSREVLDEIYENKEQVEMAKHYEQMPKPTLLATQEFIDHQIYFRVPEKE